MPPPPSFLVSFVFLPKALGTNEFLGTGCDFPRLLNPFLTSHFLFYVPFSNTRRREADRRASSAVYSFGPLGKSGTLRLKGVFTHPVPSAFPPSLRQLSVFFAVLEIMLTTEVVSRLVMSPFRGFQNELIEFFSCGSWDPPTRRSLFFCFPPPLFPSGRYRHSPRRWECRRVVFFFPLALDLLNSFFLPLFGPDLS